MANNYKEKLNEMANEVKNTANSIATEENKQKLAEAANTTMKKAKSLDKKTLAIIAAVVVAVIAVFSLFGNGAEKDAIKAVEKHMEEQGYEVTNLKVEETFEFKYKKSNAFDSGDTEFIAIIVGEYKGEKAKEEGRKYFCCEYSFMDYKDKDKGDYDNFSPQSFNEKSYIKDAVDSVIEYNKDREKQLKKNGDI